MNGLLAIVLAYLIGSIPFGLLVVKLMTGSDVRQSGSGNIGATNVLRSAGRAAGVLTLLLDISKAYCAVYLTDRLTAGDLHWISLAALVVLCGHAFPPWLKFRGGKSVASFVGAYAYLTPVPLLAVVLLFLLVTWRTRYLSLGSVIAAGMLPLACWMILHPEWPVMVSTVGAAVLIVHRHRGNLERVRSGHERIFRFGRSK